MNVITGIYLAYMFVALYMFFFIMILFLKNRKRLLIVPKPSRKYSVSVIVPAYNEEDSIKETIEKILECNYSGLKEIIIVNDGSTDNTLKILKELKRRHKILKIINKENSGKADSINQALRICSGELIAVIDADSYPEPNAIGEMVGFFNDGKVAAVTSTILVKHRKKILEKLQAIEYAMIAWTRKLLEYVNGVYVTPGALSMYRKKALENIGGFDPKNITEDIEVTWHLINSGWEVRMCIPARVYTVTPVKLKQWIRQRTRWNIGGLQVMWKYKKAVLKKGKLGNFIIPFYMLTTFLGTFGLFFFLFLTVRAFIKTYLFTSLSFSSGTQLLTASDFYITPNILNFFGAVLYLLGLFLIFFSLISLGEKELLKPRPINLFNLLLFVLIYMTIFPVLLVYSFYKIARKQKEWGTK